MKDYDKLKKQMRQLIRIAKEVIEEAEKETPNNILICDTAVEELGDLVDQISSTVLGSNTSVDEINSNTR